MRIATATALGWLALSLPAFAQDAAPAAPAPASPAARQALERPPQSPPRERAESKGATDLDTLAPTERVRLDVPMDVALAAAFIRLRARPF